MPDGVLSATEARKENREEHEKFDARLKRLEYAVLGLLLITGGSGAGSIVAKLVGG